MVAITLVALFARDFFPKHDVLHKASLGQVTGYCISELFYAGGEGVFD